MTKMDYTGKTTQNRISYQEIYVAKARKGKLLKMHFSFPSKNLPHQKLNNKKVMPVNQICLETAEIF